MKNLIIISFLFFLVSIYATQPHSDTSYIEKSEIKSFYFIGYRDENPVFYESISGNLILKKNNTLQVIGSYKNTHKPIFIENKFIVYEVKNKDKYSVVLEIDKQQKEFSLNNKIYYIVGDSNQIYCTDTENMRIWKYSFSGKEETKLKGIVSGFDRGVLFINNEYDPNVISANANIFKYDTKSQQKPIKIAENLSGENTYILPGGRYVFDYILFEGKFKPSITDVNTNKFALLDIDESFEKCYYSYQLKSLVFFNSSTLDCKEVKIPTEINLMRR